MALAEPIRGKAEWVCDSASRVYLEPFDYNGVQLLDGRLPDQFIATRDYYFAIPDDDLRKGLVLTRCKQEARRQHVRAVRNSN